MKKYSRYIFFIVLLFLATFQNPCLLNELNHQQESINLDFSSSINLIQPEWIELWGTDKQDKGQCIELDLSGNVYVAGFTNFSSTNKEDILLIKYNNLGQELWNFTWGGKWL